MIVFKAFKDRSLVQGGKRFTLGVRATTSKPTILRVSGLHACTTKEACAKYYPEHPVIVQCSVENADVRDQHDGVMVVTALTPVEIVGGPANNVPAWDNEDSDDEDQDDASSETDEIAAELRSLANRLDLL